MRYFSLILRSLTARLLKEDIPYHFKIGRPCPFKNGKVCLRATSEAGARWPMFGLVVATTTSRRDNKDQMIRPYVELQRATKSQDLWP
jgi:hypothetical protein